MCPITQMTIVRLKSITGRLKSWVPKIGSEALSKRRTVPKELCLVKVIDSSCHLPNPDVHTPMVRLEGHGDEWWEDGRLRQAVTAVCGQSQENATVRGWLDHAGRKQEHAWQAASEPLKRQSERWLGWTMDASQLESQTQAGWFEYLYIGASWADS